MDRKRRRSVAPTTTADSKRDDANPTPQSNPMCVIILMPQQTQLYSRELHHVSDKLVADMLNVVQSTLTDIKSCSHPELRIGGLEPRPWNTIGYYASVFPSMPWLLYLIDGTRPSLSLLSDRSIRITVAMEKGASVDLRVDPAHTVQHVIDLVAASVTRYTGRGHRLKLAGNALDPGCTVAECGIVDRTALTLSQPVHNNGGLIASTSRPEAWRIHKTRTWSRVEPDWRRCNPGLCVEATCTSGMCKANGRRVIVNCGFRGTDVVRDNFSCPVCGRAVVGDTPLFSDTFARFCGVKTVAGRTVVVPFGEWREFDGNGVTFLDETGIAFVKWTRLLIEARPRAWLEQCAICLEDGGERSMSRGKCGHVLHKRCSQGMGRMCPVCTAEWVDRVHGSSESPSTGIDVENTKQEATEASLRDITTEVLDDNTLSDRSITITVDTLSGKRYPVHIKGVPSPTVGDVLSHLRTWTDLRHASKLTLVHNRRRCEDEGELLSRIGVVDGSNLNLIVKSTGKRSSVETYVVPDD